MTATTTAFLSQDLGPVWLVCAEAVCLIALIFDSSHRPKDRGGEGMHAYVRKCEVTSETGACGILLPHHAQFVTGAWWRLSSRVKLAK